MKRAAIAATLLFLIVGLLPPVSEAKRAKKKKATSAGKKISITCPTKLNDINDCPDTGCGPSLDPNLNKQKNIPSLEGEAEAMTIKQIEALPDPVPGFKIGDTRGKITALGEGKKIVVVANALMVRKGGSESCNCKLTAVADTDNHIVLVDRVLKIKPGETAKQLSPAVKRIQPRQSSPTCETGKHESHARESPATDSSRWNPKGVSHRNTNV